MFLHPSGCLSQCLSILKLLALVHPRLEQKSKHVEDGEPRVSSLLDNAAGAAQKVECVLWDWD